LDVVIGCHLLGGDLGWAQLTPRDAVPRRAALFLHGLPLPHAERSPAVGQATSSYLAPKQGCRDPWEKVVAGDQVLSPTHPPVVLQASFSRALSWVWSGIFSLGSSAFFRLALEGGRGGGGGAVGHGGMVQPMTRWEAAQLALCPSSCPANQNPFVFQSVQPSIICPPSICPSILHASILHLSFLHPSIHPPTIHHPSIYPSSII